MSIMDIIWPWGRIKQLDQQRRSLLEELSFEIGQRHELKREYKEEWERADRLFTKVIKLADENLRYRRLLDNSHYRNPETGRIGKQGEYPL